MDGPASAKKPIKRRAAGSSHSSHSKIKIIRGTKVEDKKVENKKADGKKVEGKKA
jgi:hypothetical protein